MKPPLIVLLASAFAVGVGVESASGAPEEWWLLCLLVSVGLAVLWRRNHGVISAPQLLTCSLLLLAFALGGLRTTWYADSYGHSSLQPMVGSEVTLSGTIAREPDIRASNQLLYLDTGTDTVLVTTERYHHISYGDEVVATGVLKLPEAFTTDLSRTFNYSGYLLARDVEYRMSFAEVEVADAARGNVIIAQLLAAKGWFISQVDQVIPEPAAGLGKGLLLGVQSALGDDIESDFRRTGIIHIVVLSGYNVMLVAAFMLFCLSFLLPFRWRLLGGVIAIIAFALIVGLSATVVRASVMAVLVLCAQALGRRYDVTRALFLAGAVMLCSNPYLLMYDIGFQLSFMATLGLLLFVPEFESTMLQQQTWWVSVRGFLLATIATQIAVLPLLMYHIGEVSLLAIVVNVLVLPIVPLAMLLTFLAGISNLLLPALAGLVGYAAWLSLTYILQIAAYFAVIPFAAIAIPPIGSSVVLVMYVLLAVGWYWWRVRGVVTLDPLRDWEIETEAEVAQKTGGGTRSVPPPDDLPVFFR